MPAFRYGPVELYLVGVEGERPDAGTMAALSDLLESGLMRLLDLVLISKSDDGDITVTEVEADEFALELHEVGIAGEEDIAELAELVPPGGSALLVALELSYARELAERPHELEHAFFAEALVETGVLLARCRCADDRDHDLEELVASLHGTGVPAVALAWVFAVEPVLAELTAVLCAVDGRQRVAE